MSIFRERACELTVKWQGIHRQRKLSFKENKQVWVEENSDLKVLSMLIYLYHVFAYVAIISRKTRGWEEGGELACKLWLL